MTYYTYIYIYITSEEFHNDFIMISIFNFGERVEKDPQETCQGTQSHPNHPNLILFRARAQETVPQAGRKINQRYVSRCQQVINKNKHNISRLTESRDSTHYFSSFDPMQGRNSPRGAEIRDLELNHLETEMTGNDMICYFVFHETGKFHENVFVFKEHLWKMLGNDYEITMNEPKWKVRNSRDNIGYIRCSKTALGLTQYTRQLDSLTQEAEEAEEAAEGEEAEAAEAEAEAEGAAWEGEYEAPLKKWISMNFMDHFFL